MRKALLAGIDDYSKAALTGCVAEILSTHYDGSGDFDCRALW